MSAFLGIAVKVIVGGCVLWFLAGIAFAAKCMIELAWDRRHHPVQPPRPEPEIDDAVAMVKGWKAAPPVRQIKNIPVRDGTFHADGLDDAIARIMEEGL